MQRPVVDLLTENHADPESWFKRYELYIELYVGVGKSEEKGDLAVIKAKHLPFYLGGKVQATYEQLDDDLQKDFTKVKMQLLAAYRMSGATAYSKFVSMRYSGGSVDMFVSELGRLLARVPGMSSLSGKDKNGLILEQLLRGLPEGLSRELRMICVDPTSGEVPLERVLERARLLPDIESTREAAQPALRVVGALPRKEKGKLICFKCGKEGHVRTACTVKEELCFGCGKPGHRRSACPNARGGSSGHSILRSEGCP